MLRQLLLIGAVLLTTWLSVTTAYDCNPECKNGECVAYLGELSCKCPDNWSGETCDEFICATNDPCMNNGICAINPTNTTRYICACPFGFTGDKCQYQVPELGTTTNCTDDPCGMNGTCYETPGSPEGFYCDCLPGNYGPYCNFTVDACIGEDCSGYGTCGVIVSDTGEAFGYCTCEEPRYSPGIIPRLQCNDVEGYYPCLEPSFCPSIDQCEYVPTTGNFTCVCPPDKTGSNCSEPFNVCDATNRCYNGGTCSPDDGHYFRCSCPQGYTGDRCQYQTNPCSNTPCHNDGTCMVDVPAGPDGLYNATLGPVGTHCECACGFSGDDCTVRSDLCRVNPCTNGYCTPNDSPSGFNCTCPEGYAGDLCDRRDLCASSPCNFATTSECVSLEDSFVCLCEAGWGGVRCDADIDECVGNPCQNGNCTNTPGRFECTCPPDWTGKICETPLTCVDVECENGGHCDYQGGVATCSCTGGYTGSRCEVEECPEDNCGQLAGNGVCDEACFRQSCDFDGGDCYAYPNRTQVNVTNPWADCPMESTCRAFYRNGRCDVQCNTRACLFDGLDCSPTTTECLDDCGQEVLARDILVLILLANANQTFEGPLREEFLKDLGKLTNTIPIVISYKLLAREELPGQRHLVIYPKEGVSKDLLIYEVFLKLNLAGCTGHCPNSAEEAADWIQADIDNGNKYIGPYGVASATATPDNNVPDGGYQWAFAFIAVGAIALILVVVIIMIVRKRQRSYEVDEGVEGTKKVRASIWRPGSPGSDAGASRSSPPVDKKKSGGNKAGPVLVSKDGTPAPPEDPDKYIADGSHRAGMEPQQQPSQIEWAPVTKPIDKHTPQGSTPNKDSEAVVAQVGDDKRSWSAAHFEALHNPQRIRSLVEEYRRQNGSTHNVNARGPGGFTPLMLVVMKRHSSHDTVAYPSRGSSESGGSDYSDHSALLPQPGQHRMGSKVMGRPSSTYSHDTGFYSTGSQISPVDSSVGALIEAKVDLDITNDYGQTALYLSCACSRGDYVEQLLEAGANPNIQDNWGQSALQAAIDAAAEGAFVLLVNHPRADLNLKSDGGITPLIAAVKVVNQFMVKQLLKKNVDIGATDKDGRTAVHWAAMVDNLDALKQLIRQGPDAIKDAQDSKGQTALFLACREGSAGCVKHLLDCFANATLMDSLEQSPIQIAYQKQHLDIVEMLRATTQGPFPVHSQAPPMRGIPNMSGGYSVPPQYPEDMGQGQYPHQLVHPKKSSKLGKRHTRTESIDSMGPGTSHTPTYISNVHTDTSAFRFAMPQNGDRYTDLNVVARSQPGGIQMRNYGPPHSSYAPTSETMHMPVTSSDFHVSKTSPINHPNGGYFHPITPPDSATLKIQPTTIPLTSASDMDEIQAVSDLITSIADNPPVTSHQYNSPVYPETSVGGSQRLHHFPLADNKQSYQQQPPPPSDPTYNHMGPSPQGPSSGTGSPSSVYPSPPNSNELQQQTFQGYQYPTNTCSPPSLTPSPESREAQQQYRHEIMTDTYIETDHGMGHMMPQFNVGYHHRVESSV